MYGVLDLCNFTQVLHYYMDLTMPEAVLDLCNFTQVLHLEAVTLQP